MKNFSNLFIFALIAACGIFIAPPQLLMAANTNTISAVKGDKFFTQFNLFYDHDNHVHLTTNYRNGMLVPINTEVTFVKASKKEIDVKLPDDAILKIENVEKYSGENINVIFTRTLGKTNLNLSGFSVKEREGIEGCEAQIGMSKAAVIATLGYPPEHQTPTLKGNHWRYWKSTFSTFTVIFEDDKVKSIED